jgi:uncharacterized membrane protein YjgN (DUF898 family)
MTAIESIMPAPSDGVPEGRVTFLGREAAYWRLRIKGAALLMFTLGIYRFWFATDVRRYLWSNIEIGGETLEYTGLATELLGGFLLAVAIVGPLYTAIASAALALDTAETAVAGAGVLLFVLLGQFALYRARRYRLTRTVFRGVRFDQHGSAWRYAIFALMWWALAAATFGLAYPWAQANLQRYKMRHTSYGDLDGGFAGSGLSLFLRGLPIWLCLVGPIVAALVALDRTVDWNALNAMMAQGDGKPLALLVGNSGLDVFAVITAAAGASIAAAVLLYPLFTAMMMRWWISGLRFGAVAVQSRLSVVQVYRIYLRFLLYAVPYGLAVSAIGGASIFLSGKLVGSNHDSMLAELFASMLSLAIYVIIVLGVSTIYQVIVTFAMWRLSAQTTDLLDAEALDRVRAAGVPDSALGEGLVDALGVGGI